MKKEILKKLFILDILLGVILLIIGIYLKNNFIIAGGVLSLIVGIINPNKIMLNKIDKMKGNKKKITNK